MKGLTWKKIMSLVLAVALIIGGLQFNAKTAKAGNEKVSGAYAEVTDGENTLEPTIEFSVVSQGDSYNDDTRKNTDVVLVIDLSNSMGEKVNKSDSKTKLEYLKEAANGFCDTLFGEDSVARDFTRLAVVTYGDTASVVYPSSYGYYNNTEAFVTKSNYTALKTKISNLSVKGGTNMQDGLRKAENLLAASTAKKVIVLLSDGVPTWGYANRTEVSWNYYGQKTQGLIASGSDNDYNYFKDSEGNEYRQAKGHKSVYKKTVTTKEVSIGNGYDGTIAGYPNPDLAEIKENVKSEAAKAINSNIEIITVSYCNEADSELMAAIASSKTTNFSGTNAINAVLKEIGTNITKPIYAGTNAVITATLADEFVQKGNTPNGVEINGSTITWTIGDIGKTTTETTDKSGNIALKVKTTVTVDALAAKYGVVNGFINIPISTNAVLTYTDSQGQTQNVDVNETGTLTIQIPVITYTIRYMAEDLEGKFTQIGDDEFKYATSANQVITADVKTAADLGLSKYYEDPDCTVPADNDNVITVKAYRKTADVTFVAKDEKGENYNVEVLEDVKYGTEIEVGGYEIAPYFTVEPVETTNVTGEAVNVDVNVKHEFLNKWKIGETTVDEGSKKIVEGALTYYAQYSDAPETVTRKVIFVVDKDRSEEFEAEVGSEYGGPTINTDKAADLTNTYKFLYWSLKENGEKANVVTVIPDTDVTYYAVYEATPIAYSVEFFIGEDSIGTDTFGYEDAFNYNGDYDAKARAAAEAMSTVDTEYTFAGWDTTGYEDENGVKHGVYDGVVYGDDTATAKFTSKELTCTITYLDYQGNEIKEYETVVKRGTTEIAVKAGPVRTKDDHYYYNFEGWFNDGETLAALIGDGILDDITVQAVYSTVRYANLTFFKKAFESESNEAYVTVEYTENTTKAEFATLAPNGKELLGETFDYWKAVIKYAPAERTIAPRANADDITFEMLAEAYPDENPVDVVDIEFYPVFKPAEEPIVIPDTPDDPTPSPTQGAEIKIVPVTPTPTAEPTPEPTAAPTPTEEPIEIEETETPEGDVEIEETETPEGAPEEEEELEVEPIDTPQGDLPQTGVAPSAVFFGIGAACVVFGGAIVIKLRRKEEM